MAERTVSVKLIADARAYIEGMDKAVQKTRDSTQTVEQQLAAQRDAFNQVGTAATAVGVLAVAGVTAAVAAYSQFDAAMSGVQAATHASTEEMDLLGDAALAAGQRTVYSATEAAAAIENLARAGISTTDILGGGLDGALDLAAAGGLEVADAAEIAASAMTQFGLSGRDVSHVADLLAAGAGKAQGGVTELGQALNQSGLVAAQMGLSVEETVGSLTAFASAGLIGSDAGTSFRAMLLRLANPTNESRQLMDDLGLSFYDTQGQFIGMEAVAGQLSTQMGGLTQETRNAALATIFGQDAIRSASILYDQGAEGVRNWTTAVDEQGYAAETAAIRLDNLKGDLEALGGAFETLMINLGAGADGPLREGVQGLTEVVEWLGNLDPAAQTAFLAVLGVVGIVGTVGGASLIAVPKIAEFRTALTVLGITAGTTSAAIAPLAIALGTGGLLIAGLVAIGAHLDSTRPSAERWAEAIRGGATAADLLTLANQGFINTIDGAEFDTSKVTEYVAQMRRIEESNGWGSFLPENWDVQFTDFASRMRQIDEQLSQLSAEDAAAALDRLRQSEELAGISTEDLNFLLPRTAGVLEDTADAAVVAEEGVAAVGDASATAAQQAQQLLDVQQAIVDAFFAAQDSMSSYEQAIDDITAAMTGDDALVPALQAGGEGFDLTQQAGRDAAAMMGELVTAAQGASDAMHENGASADELAGYQAAAREQIYNTGIEMGLSETAARAYSERLLGIPNEVSSDVRLNIAQAEQDIANLTRTRTMIIDVFTRTQGENNTYAPASQRGVQFGRASGGRIPGYSPGFDDHLGYLPGTGMIGLAGGEWIINPHSSARYDSLLRQINDGTLPGFAGGGRVSEPSFTPQFAPIVNVAGPSGPLDARLPASFVRQLGDYVAAQLRSTGQSALARATAYADHAIEGEAVVRR